MNNESTSENETLLSDRQLLEQILARLGSLEQNMSESFASLNQRILSLEVQTETITSLAYQALSVAHAVKGDVRALREESALHGRDIEALQKRLLTMA
jgi:hypothetical protein